MIKITKKGKKAWVTFSKMPAGDEEIILCGTWSDWKEEAMKVKKSGEHYLTKVLKCNESYEFGYKVDGHWECDSDVPTVDSPFGSKNSLIEL
jgi:hypothetical protein